MLTKLRGLLFSRRLNFFDLLWICVLVQMIDHGAPLWAWVPLSVVLGVVSALGERGI